MKSFKKDIFRTASNDCVNCVAHNIDIGTQTWTGCNANVKFYNNGDPIPYVDDNANWVQLTTGAWCYYNNDPTTEATYGILYNWFAVNDARGIAPTGWHLPSDAEWTTLTTLLGGETVAGGKMKEEGFCHWVTPNVDATNTSLFTALPGGFRNDSGYYYTIGTSGNWWSSTVLSTNTGFAYYRYITNNSGSADRSVNNKKIGLSVRFIKDEVCLDCIPHNVTIGSQVWAGCNTTITAYRDNTTIPYVEDIATWAALTTGAWCYPDGDPTKEVTYGKLYNWQAVAGIHDAASLLDFSLRKQFAPVGWHVPTDPEFTILADFLGGQSIAGGKMKEEGFCHWNPPNVGATNSSLFTVLPAGYRDLTGYFYSGTRYNAVLWSASLTNFDKAYNRQFDRHDDDCFQSVNGWNQGHSVRFIQGDAPTVCTASCSYWSYTYSTWSAWSTCVGNSQSRTRTKTGRRTCIQVDCSLVVENSSVIESESQFCGDPCTDCIATDVQIGSQWWTKCNATVTKYRDNTDIPQITNALDWKNATTGAWCWYNNASTNDPKYGKLYNWYAVAGIHDAASATNPALRKQFAPVGYHVPSDAEITTLTTFLGGDAIAGGTLKQQGICKWNTPNTGAVDTYGFAALPGGQRDWSTGNFNSVTFYGTFWTSTEHPSVTTHGRCIILTYSTADVNRTQSSKTHGQSVRFIKD